MIKILKYSLFILSLLFLFFGCASTGINTEELNSYEFHLSSIGFFSFVRGFDINGQEFFAKLPLDEVINAIENKYGIIVNSEIFIDTKNAIKQIDPEYPSSWTVKSDRKTSQSINMSLMIPAYTPNLMEANYTIIYTTKSGEVKEIESFYLIENWMEKAGIK